MSEFQSQKKKLEARIEEMKSHYDRLRARTKYKVWNTVESGEKRLDELGSRITATERRLREATENSWDKVKDDIQDSWERLQDEVDELKKAA